MPLSRNTTLTVNNALSILRLALGKRLRQWRWTLCLLSSLGALLTPTTSWAAEELIISYGILERSIALADLEHFAKTGELSPQLQSYNRRLQFTPTQLEQIRQVLVAPAEDLNHVAIAQFLYTEQGRLLLNELIRVVRTPARQGDFPALRAALILGADNATHGVTLLDILRAYPLDAIRIDLAEGFAIAQEVNRAIMQAEQAVDLVQTLAHQEAEAAPLDPDSFSNLLRLIQRERRYGVRRADLIVSGLPRPVTLYLPQPQPGQTVPPQGFPVVVVSHGLGGSRDSYTYLANFLASGGIAVAAIEHAGSNDEQLLALLEGRSDEVVSDEEFVRRPQDVSLTLNALARAQANSSDLPNRLDLSRVGVVGQSFGGYTALALAGAPLSIPNLQQQCPPSQLTLNPSLLLQCQAANLGNPRQSLADPRVNAIFIMNPIGSVLFGQDGYGQVKTPVMVVGGAGDTVAPAFPEQIQPFTWLTTGDRYLLLLHQGTHFSVIGDIALADQPLVIPPTIIGPRPDLAQAYMQVFGLAFFKLTLAQDERFRPLLQSAFVERLSGDNYPLSLTTTLTQEALNQSLQ